MAPHCQPASAFMPRIIPNLGGSLHDPWGGPGDARHVDRCHRHACPSPIVCVLCQARAMHCLTPALVASRSAGVARPVARCGQDESFGHNAALGGRPCPFGSCLRGQGSAQRFPDDLRVVLGLRRMQRCERHRKLGEFHVRRGRCSHGDRRRHRRRDLRTFSRGGLQLRRRGRPPCAVPDLRRFSRLSASDRTFQWTRALDDPERHRFGQ
jgi:hypothetical protein